MKKIILLIFLLVSSYAYAIDICVTITDDPQKQADLISAMRYINPMPQVNNSNGTGTVGTGPISEREDDFGDKKSGIPMVDQYTDLQWFRVLIRDYVREKWLKVWIRDNERVTSDTNIQTQYDTDKAGVN